MGINDLLKGIYQDPFKPTTPKPQQGPPAPKSSAQKKVDTIVRNTSAPPVKETVKKSLNVEQAARGGKSRAQVAKETPGTWENAVQNGRKILGIKEGSDEDKALKSLLWTTINQDPNKPSHVKDVDGAEVIRVYKLIREAKKGTPSAQQEITTRIQGAREILSRPQPEPTIKPLAEDMRGNMARRAAMEQSYGGAPSQAENSDYIDNLVNNLKTNVGGGPVGEFITGLAGEILLAPLRGGASLQYAGNAANQISQGNTNFKAGDVAGPVAGVALDVAGSMVGAPIVGSLLKRSSAIAKVLAKLNKVDPAEAKGFIATVQALQDEGVEDAYKVAKQLREAAKEGKYQDLREAIIKSVPDSSAARLAEDLPNTNGRAKFTPQEDLTANTGDVPNLVGMAKEQTVNAQGKVNNFIPGAGASIAGDYTKLSGDELIALRAKAKAEGFGDVLNSVDNELARRSSSVSGEQISNNPRAEGLLQPKAAGTPTEQIAKTVNQSSEQGASGAKKEPWQMTLADHIQNSKERVNQLFNAGRGAKTPAKPVPEPKGNGKNNISFVFQRLGIGGKQRVDVTRVVDGNQVIGYGIRPNNLGYDRANNAANALFEEFQLKTGNSPFVNGKNGGAGQHELVTPDFIKWIGGDPKADLSDIVVNIPLGGVVTDKQAMSTASRVVANEHRNAIEQALKEGKPVPSEVLADYPDLAKRYANVTEVPKVGEGKLTTENVPPLKETPTVPRTTPTVKLEAPKLNVHPDVKIDAPILSDAVAKAKARKAARATTKGENVSLSSGFDPEVIADVVDDAIIYVGEKAMPIEAAIRSALKAKGLGEDAYNEVKKGVHGELGIEDVKPKAPKVETPKPVEAPQIKAEGQIKATGLANQVQEREAIDGAIGKIDSVKGKTAEELHAMGRESGITSDGATDLAQKIATGDVPLTPENIGKLLEGKRLKMNEIADLRAKSATNPGKYSEKLFDAEAELQTYLENVQIGKGQWADMGRAMQVGTSLDYGNIEDVLVRAKASGKEVSEKAAAAFKKQSEDWAKAEADYQAQIAELQKEKAKEAFNTARRSTRPAKVEALRKEWADLFDQFKNIRNTAGVGTKKTRGAASKITAEDLKVAKDQAIIVKRIAENYIREGAPHIEDVVAKVKLAFKENLDIDIEDQAVIDALATTEKGATKTEIGERLATLKKEAKDLSTPTKESRAAKASERKAIQDAKAKIQAATKREKEARNLERKHLADADRMTKEVERLRLREKASQAAEIAKQEKLVADTLRKKAEKEFGEQWRREDKLFQTNEEIKNLEQQLKDGRFSTPQKKSIKEQKIDQEILDAQARKRVLQKQIDMGIRDMYRSKTEKIVTGTLDFARASQLGGDLGVITRQGLFFNPITKPKAVGKAFQNAFKSAFSEQSLAKIEHVMENARIDGKALAPIRKKAGLSLTTSMNHAEEVAFARLIKKVPIIGDKVGGSLERFQTAYLNTIRSEVFDQAVRKGFTDEELAVRARFINNATGRGNVKNVPKLAQLVFTSPRYEISRWGTLAEPFKNVKQVGLDAFMRNPANRGAIENIKDLAGTAAMVYGVFKTAEIAGYEVNYDPTSSDFLKMRKGDDVWDVSAGLAPRIRDVMRAVIYSLDPTYGKTVFDVSKDAFSRSINPAVKTPADIATKGFQRGVLKEDKPKGISGFEAKEGEPDGIMQLSPLIVQSFLQALNENGPQAATWAALREFVGSGANRYPENKKPTALTTLDKKIKKAQK